MFKEVRHRPIFILGMPRSGTTLIEQIISNHTQVHGAGELPLMGRICSPFHLGSQAINSDNIRLARKTYLDELAKVSNGSHFVTDKMPQNFLFIGFILKAIPEASNPRYA